MSIGTDFNGTDYLPLKLNNYDDFYLIKTELVVEIKKIIESELGIPYNNIIIVKSRYTVIARVENTAVDQRIVAVVQMNAVRSAETTDTAHGQIFAIVGFIVGSVPTVFISTAKEQGCQIICCSALLTTTMNEMENVVKVATEKGIRENVFIMVGGAPITQEYCDKIGADCYTTDAASAAQKAKELVG